jgi:hypothetical protein
MMRLQQGFVAGEMGFRVSLHASNPEPLMSALDQKRTLRGLDGMSALPPKADIDESDCHVRFVPIADIRRRPSALPVIETACKGLAFRV